MNAAIDSARDETVAMLRESIERYTSEHYSFESAGAHCEVREATATARGRIMRRWVGWRCVCPKRRAAWRLRRRRPRS